MCVCVHRRDAEKVSLYLRVRSMSNHTIPAEFIHSCTELPAVPALEAVGGTGSETAGGCLRFQKGFEIDGIKVIANCACQKTKSNLHSEICVLNLFQENDYLQPSFPPAMVSWQASHANNISWGSKH